MNPRQLTSYREHRKTLIKWTLDLGKEPKKANGYANATAKTRAKRLDKFYRWVWEHEDRYTENITTDHADRYMKELAHTEYSSSYKACCQKAVKTLFKWQSFQKGEDVDWEPVITYSDSTGTDAPRDFLTRDNTYRSSQPAS
jgi:site-specific recombinase XerD